MIQPVASGFFTLDGSGKGAPVSSAVRVDADGSRTDLPTMSCGQNGQCVAIPIAVSPTGQTYLSLYGTGFRHAASARCQIAGAAVTPSYFGPQGESPGVDQVNLMIPADTPKGQVDVSCSFRAADDGGVFTNALYGLGNTVTLSVR
jgi:uncharacterized protein (TIGR03437 family)